ncbi:MAG TPA: fibronectin type III domain-containing protein [Gemmatimonadaceae bacterium]|nr:fibronectin type III domain-containing protein [Gemmatimonadaceae bacterium]
MRISRLLAASVTTLLLAVAACNDDSTSPGPKAPASITVTPVGTTTLRITFEGKKGESYEIERAVEDGTAFTLVKTIAELTASGTQTYDDTGLLADESYRYRVTAVKGTSRSVASSAVAGVTCAACVEITTDILTSRTFFADTIYKLKGFIHVGNGATLTIQPGTTIKGDYTTLGSALMILKGAKIQAVGTAAQPIVFTSSRQPGQRQPGDWGGLLLVGNGINNRSGQVAVEGTGTDGATVVGGKNYTVVYNGGQSATDNSGTLKYVRVEFAGYAPIQDQEFNAFTFCAVGSGTRASFLESLAPLDDSFEFFGGGFDIDHIIAFETADDMFDMSEGWVGRMQFLIGINTTQLTPRTGSGFYSVDIEGIENDGCNGSGCDNTFDTQPFTIPLVANFTMIGCGRAQCVGPSGGHGMMLRRGTGGYYMNGVVSRWPSDGISLRDAQTYNRGGATRTPAATADLQVRNIFFSEMTCGGQMIACGANGASPQPLMFQAVSASQFDLDPAANNLTLGAVAVTTASLFTKIPDVGATPSSIDDFDFTPAAGSAIATGGSGAFTGAVATKGGTFITGTTYQGAVAPGGADKWWQGWTAYYRN